MEKLFGYLAESTMPDSNGVPRRSLDIAGNGRFVRNLVERSEEEREYRLDHSDHDDFTDEEMMTITAGDVNNSAAAAAWPGLDGARMTTPGPSEDRRSLLFPHARPTRIPTVAPYRRGFVTRNQVSGWRFVMRRIASGVALHDTRMLVDPLRTQSRAVLTGALILVTGLVGCFMFSLIRPGGVGRQRHGTGRPVDRDAVRAGGRAIASGAQPRPPARLIAGKADNPTTVKTSEIDKYPRGNLLGIPGAPERMVQSTSADADWTVFDSNLGRDRRSDVDRRHARVRWGTVPTADFRPSGTGAPRRWSDPG